MKPENQLPRKRGRPSLSDGEAVLNNLCRVAFAHFFLNGIEGANMQLIAKEAGVSRQMIHKRFGSKEQFFEKMLKHGQASLRQKYIYHGANDIKDPWVLLNHLGNEMFETFVDPEGIATFRMLDLVIFRHAEVAEMHNKSLNDAYRNFSRMLRDRAKARGKDLKIGKSEIRDFISLIRGYAKPVIQGCEKPPSKRMQKKEINGIVVRFLRGLGFGEPPV